MSENGEVAPELRALPSEPMYNPNLVTSISDGVNNIPIIRIGSLMNFTEITHNDRGAGHLLAVNLFAKRYDNEGEPLFFIHPARSGSNRYLRADKIKELHRQLEAKELELSLIDKSQIVLLGKICSALFTIDLHDVNERRL